MQVGEKFELPGEGEAFLIKRSALNGDAALQFDWTLEAGKPGPPMHVHPEEDEIIRVIEGTARVRLDGEVRVLNAGESLRMPAGVPHQIRGEGKTRLIVQVTYAPGAGFERLLDVMRIGGFRGFSAMCQFVSQNPHVLRPSHVGIRLFMRLVGGLGWLFGVRAPAARPELPAG